MTASNDSPDLQPAERRQRIVTVELNAFVSAALEDEARAMNVPVEELASFALLYYIADRDSGRTARRLPHRAADGAKHAARDLQTR
jgi:hypothetical protein